MNLGNYILVNGTFLSIDEYRISIAESDGFLFSEKIRSVRTSLPFFRETLEVIKLKFQIFNHSFPEFTEREGANLKRQLERTLTKNKLFLGAILTMSFSWYNEKINYTIRSEKTATTGFDLNERGLYVNIFKEIQKPASALSNLTIGSEIYWNIAKQFIGEEESDDFLIVNLLNQVVESPGSNIFLIKGHQIRGASVEQGAYLDITFSMMLGVLLELGLEYSENEGITIQDIRSAEEIMLVNAIEGIRWIVGFEGKRYYNNTIRKISVLFNQRLIQ